MRLADGAFINNVARLEKTEDIEKESAEVDMEIEKTEAQEKKPEEEEIKEETTLVNDEEESF